MLELEGHLEDRAFDDELLAIAQDLPGQQDLAYVEREHLDHVLKLEDPTVAKRGAERAVHEPDLELLVNSALAAEPDAGRTETRRSVQPDAPRTARKAANRPEKRTLKRYPF